MGLLRVLAPSLGLLVSQFLNRTRTRSSGTSSRSSGSSRSSSSRSSSSRSSFCVCSTKQRQHDAHQERSAQSNVHARPRDARSGKQAARVHATASRPTSVLASSTQANVQATLHMYVCVQVCSTCSSALSKCRASRPYVAECTRKHDAWRRGPARDRAASSRPGDGQRDRRRSAHRLWEIGQTQIKNREVGRKSRHAR